MLPDCFGFPASLPSILAHSGIKGFSRQKLTWRSAAQVGGAGSLEDTPVDIPFNVGIWEGPDGRGMIAVLNPGSYDGNVDEDLSNSEEWIKRIQLNGRQSGLFTDYHDYGVGDVDGAPREHSVELVEKIVTKGVALFPRPQGPSPSLPPRGPAETVTRKQVPVGDGPLKVISATAEQMFLDIKPDQTTHLPRYQGDLLLIEHSAGSLTSQAYHKRWNRKNELLVDAAERASVAAEWLAGRAYPLKPLNNAWTLGWVGNFTTSWPAPPSRRRMSIPGTTKCWR